MNLYLLSVILGVIEGLTEFLPVSSTAHLRLAEAFVQTYFSVPGLTLQSGYWKTYTIVIQLGAVLCLPFYFRERIKRFVRYFPGGERGDKSVLTHPLSLTILAFCVTAVPSFLLIKVVGGNLERPTLMAWSLIFGGIVMWLVDHLFGGAERQVNDISEVSAKQAIWIGACQILSAIFPGVSRSMATIAAGQLAGMSRAAALEFSFFLSIPTMLAATLYQLLKAIVGTHRDVLSPGTISQEQWILLAIGFAVSFAVAYGVVAWFMRWVRSRGFVPFAIYRILAGVAVLYWAYSR